MTSLAHRLLYLLTLSACIAPSLPAQPTPAGAQTRGEVEATSGLGRKLYALPDNAAISGARAELEKDPKNVALVLKLSKAQAGQRQYREAILTDTKGLAFALNDADLYTERGHRELGLRLFRPAMADLQHAVSLGPGKLDAHYHLGLAHYFQGEFAEAAQSFHKALDLAKISDSIIDCDHWLYVSLRRAGQEQEATEMLKRITPEMTNTEPHLKAYLQLLRFYQGAGAESTVTPTKPAPGDTESELGYNTQTYAVGNWYLYHHDPARARVRFNSVVTGDAWNSWGFIGAETELIRMRAQQ